MSVELKSSLPMKMEITTVQGSIFTFANEVNNAMKHHGWSLHGEPHIMEMVCYPHPTEGVMQAPEKALIFTQILKREIK